MSVSEEKTWVPAFAGMSGFLKPLRQRGDDLVDDGLERGGVGPCDVGEDLAVDFDAGQFKAVHKSRISQAFEPGRGVDALDPQGAELTLAHLAVAVGVLAGLVDRGLGRAD